MRVLMLSPNPLTPRLGASKVRIELAEAMRACGGNCDLAGPEEIGENRLLNRSHWARFAAAQRAYILSRADKYDVIDFDHESLPFARSEFDHSLLLVARSVLLIHQIARIPRSAARTPRSLVARMLRGRSHRRFQAMRVRDATQTIHHADLVNVSNDDDQSLLLREGGCSGEKVVIFPFGLSRARRELFQQACATSPPPEPIVGFVGTVDWRKGAADFPRIVADVLASFPSARFRLLGTKGLMRTARDVYARFPRTLRARIEVVPEFDPDMLPTLLADCAVGVFPSYLEGFGFGVLEMLTAAIPVIAYNAPGPPMMLGREWLVPPGNVTAMASKVVSLLRDREALAAARAAARRASEPFDWDDIARRTIGIYADRLSRLRTRRAPA